MTVTTPRSTSPRPTANSTRCAATTKSGAPCSRAAVEGSTLCAQHGRTANGSGAQANAQRQSPPAEPSTEERFARIVDELSGGRGNSDPFDDAPPHRDAHGVLANLLQVGEMVMPLLERVRNGGIGTQLISPERWDEALADATSAFANVANYLSRRVKGDYDEDDFGFDPEYTAAVEPIFSLLYDHWWRVETHGVENVPASGRALVISNHAGAGLPFDGAMMKIAVLRQHPERHLRLLVLDFLMGLPWIGDFARRTGQTLACSENAIELLNRDELVGVFPEGIKGMAKPFSKRYQLDRFGRGGFVRIALRTGAPIIPCAVVGSEEIYPKIGNVPMLHHLIGAPFVPMTPTFPWLGLAGLVPLPSKWHIEFMEPIDLSQYGPEAADDRTFVLEMSERIRVQIQEKLHENLLRRSNPFW